VATVVALRGLGLSIGDSLVANVRASNRGDITLSTDGASGFFAFAFIAGGQDNDNFSPNTLNAIRAYTADLGGAMTEYKLVSNLQVTAFDYVSAGRPQFINVLLIDPATFPVRSDDPTNALPPVLASDPPGVPLGELLRQPTDIVVSRNLADLQDLQVGDTVRVSNTTDVYTVRGIVPTETEANLRNPFASFFGFAYVNISQAEPLQLTRDPNTVSLLFPPGTDLERAEGDLRNLTRFNVSSSTVPELLEQNQAIADVLGRFIVFMGLGALLIGGVGIINTMLVMVGRRTSEIAALKTFGLKGRQIALLFLAEAALLGLAGSLVGCVLGTLLTGAVNRYGETFLQQRLAWGIYPEAIAFGLILGMIVTLVFGVLPVLTANRVRPATILRPNETIIPRAGCLHSLIALALVVIVIGSVAGRIVGGGAGVMITSRASVPSELIGMIVVGVTLLILGLLVALLWLVVWLVSKLPAFGWVDLRLALRNLTARRVRTATTLLALSAGMFALSSITFVGVGTREILQFQIAQTLGGNVLVFPLLNVFNEGIAQITLNAQLNLIDGVTYRTRYLNRNAYIRAIDGQPWDPYAANAQTNDFGAGRINLSGSTLLTIRDSDNPNLRTGSLIAGRDLLPSDRGQKVMVISGVDSLLEAPPIPVGSTVTLEIDGIPYNFEVVGHTGGSGLFNFGQYHIPPDAVPTVPGFSFSILQVDDANLNNVLLSLSENPLIFALDITFIDGLLSRLIDQFSAIPTLVGLLSLLAAGVAMANTVALATLERRRQIGILKAVGLKGRRVLGVLLLENTLIGALGGLLGIGLSALGVAIMTWIGQGTAIPIPRDAVPTTILLLVASLAIAWTATFLSARSVTSERVINVLRYE
jgi:ABC-type antimicrobial peptide transport system permease subunit